MKEKQAKTKSKTLPLNYNIAEIAMVDFSKIKKEIPYTASQSIEMALTKLRIMEKQGFTLDDIFGIENAKEEIRIFVTDQNYIRGEKVRIEMIPVIPVERIEKTGMEYPIMQFSGYVTDIDTRLDGFMHPISYACYNIWKELARREKFYEDVVEAINHSLENGVIAEDYTENKAEDIMQCIIRKFSEISEEGIV